MDSNRARSVQKFIRFYGAHPLHLLALVMSFALVGYVIMIAGPETLWNHSVWWQSIAIWFLGAVVAHDLVLFPLYALADRSVTSGLDAMRGRTATHGPAAMAGWTLSPLNYIRIPAMGAALTFILFFPGIVEQGSQTFYAATGLDQDPYLARWLILVAVLFGVSALAYALRISLLRSRA